MIRAFLDANILFTASYNTKGLAHALIYNQSIFKAEIITSTYAISEARYNLNLKAPNTLEIFDALLNHIQVVPVVLRPDFNPLCLPPSDVPIFQGALTTESSHLLTGDKKAFGPWMNQPKKTFTVTIQTVREFVDAFIRTDRS